MATCLRKQLKGERIYVGTISEISVHTQVALWFEPVARSRHYGRKTQWRKLLPPSVRKQRSTEKSCQGPHIT